jgi:hypothetical protein
LLTVRRDTGGDYRIFFTNNRNVNISGLTITNGKTPDGASNTGQPGGNGGGILESGGVLVLTDVTVTGNSTGNGGPNTVFGGSSGGFGGFGGGIYATGSLTLTNCVVSNNITGNGGNGSSGGSGGRGGGIWFGTGSLTLQKVVVTDNHTGTTGGPNGGVSGYAGGIWTGGEGFSPAFATTSMTNVTITNNTTGNTVNGESGEGAGLFIMTGPATLTNSTVSNNRCGNSTNSGGGSGGGILNNGNLTVINSLISGNSTGDQTTHGSNTSGGGIRNLFILTLINSTISGNRTGTGFSNGAGIANGSTLTMYNCTVTGNSSIGSTACCQGHGLVGASGTIGNSIIAGNGPGGNGPDLSHGFSSGSFNSRGHNLIGNADGATGFVNGSNNDQVGTTGAPLDPQLAPLANNGGPTLTHAFLTNSPALDAGDDCVTQPTHCGDSNIPQLTTDQRGMGFNRIVDGPDADTTATVDIGAYEKQALFPNLAATSVNEDTQLIVAFDVNDPASITSVTATSSNLTLVPNNPANIDLTNAGASEILTINPSLNLSGVSDITVTVNRTGSSEIATFTLTVNPVNDAPSFIKGLDQSVSENDPAQIVNNWATSISPGPSNESAQSLSFQVITDSNAALFAVPPAISSSGTLTYTPAAHASGTAAITIALKDNGGVANGGMDTSATQTFNINVLEGGLLQFSLFSYSVSEGGGNALITVNRIGGIAGEARVDYATSNGSAAAGQDYTATSGTLTLANGVSTQTFSVPITNDSFDETNETINLTLTNAAGSGSLGSPATASLSIVDDDPSPTLSINDVQVSEGNSGATNAVFTVTLSGATALTATVSFATANNTANFSDYQPTAGQLSFSPGETTKTITVPVTGDTINEPTETFFVNLSTPTNATLSRFRGVGTILNDDLPKVSFAAADFSINENSSAGFVTVSVIREGDATSAASVNFATSDTSSLNAACSDVTGKASERCDYATSLGTLSWAAGDAGTKTFAIPIINDALVEGTETFNVTLSNPIGVNLGATTTATVTIADNDSNPPGPNPIDGVDFFITQQYIDFLGRMPDAGGFANWQNTLAPCPNGGFGENDNPNCDRIHVAAGFFQSDEFLNRGYWAFRFYMVSYNQRPTYAQFIPDMAQVGGPKSPAQEEASKVAFADAYVQRPEFVAKYPGLSGQPLANALWQTAGLPGSPITAGSLTKGQILRTIVETSASLNQFLVDGTVAIQYFGFLRRDPDTIGYQNNLATLRSDPNNLRHMIFIFIYSTEYRGRFGTP